MRSPQWNKKQTNNYCNVYAQVGDDNLIGKVNLIGIANFNVAEEESNNQSWPGLIRSKNVVIDLLLCALV